MAGCWEGWGNDGHCGLPLFTPCHSVLSYPDRQTLVGVGGISSSFLGEVRSKNYSHIPMFSLQHLQQSTELKSNNFLQ